MYKRKLIPRKFKVGGSTSPVAVLDNTRVVQTHPAYQFPKAPWEKPALPIVLNTGQGYKVTPELKLYILDSLFKYARSFVKNRPRQSWEPKAPTYNWSSKDINSGSIDCSGFSRAVYQALGFDIGEGTYNLWKGGLFLGSDLSQALEGDLIINLGSNRNRHVRIVTKNNNGDIRVIESSRAGDGVTEGPLDRSHLIGKVGLIRPLVTE